jgi:uncharacterized membrane protein
MMLQLHHWPVSPGSFAVVAGLLMLLLALVQIGLLRHAYMSLGMNSRTAMFLLAATLLGSYLNIPIAELPAQNILSGQEFDVYGTHYMLPTLVDRAGIVVAVNVGGALIPALMSLYLLASGRLWGLGIPATFCVAGVCHWLAHPVAGQGIELPMLVPAMAAAAVALVLSPSHAARLAYIGGSLGTLIGADLLNLDKLQQLGAPIVSIGGAGTFDGVFLAGIVAVLVAALVPNTRSR